MVFKKECLLDNFVNILLLFSQYLVFGGNLNKTNMTVFVSGSNWLVSHNQQQQRRHAILWEVKHTFWLQKWIEEKWIIGCFLRSSAASWFVAVVRVAVGRCFAGNSVMETWWRTALSCSWGCWHACNVASQHLHRTSGPSNLVKASSNLGLPCFLGPQDSPPQAGSRTVEPCLHSSVALQTPGTSITIA